MEFEGKALYNLLRMNWLENPDLQVEPWQVEDYRLLEEGNLQDRLFTFGISIDKRAVQAYSENCDGPEHLTDFLIADQELEPSAQDQIYLLVFELWRRWLPEELSISIFCDDLDLLIYQYDRSEITQIETVQDALASLKSVIDENADEGGDPVDIFRMICANCANDVESFLYDFIADQLDNENKLYASELVESFYDYVEDVEWFDLLKARLLSALDEEGADQVIIQLLEEIQEDPALDLLIEILAFASKETDVEIFLRTLRLLIPLLKTEEDFQETLRISLDFCDFSEREHEEIQVQKIINSREGIDLDTPLPTNDKSIHQLWAIFHLEDQYFETVE